jgi:hypothetical protein
MRIAAAMAAAKPNPQRILGVAATAGDFMIRFPPARPLCPISPQPFFKCREILRRIDIGHKAIVGRLIARDKPRIVIDKGAAGGVAALCAHLHDEAHGKQDGIAAAAPVIGNENAPASTIREFADQRRYVVRRQSGLIRQRDENRVKAVLQAFDAGEDRAPQAFGVARVFNKGKRQARKRLAHQAAFMAQHNMHIHPRHKVNFGGTPDQGLAGISIKSLFRPAMRRDKPAASSTAMAVHGLAVMRALPYPSPADAYDYGEDRDGDSGRCLRAGIEAGLGMQPGILGRHLQ